MDKEEFKYSDLIVDLIKDEWEAIQGYNKTIKELLGKVPEDVISVLRDILDEENIHVGQLQELLKKYDSSADNILKGEEEAIKQLKGEEDDFEPEDDIEEEIFEALRTRGF